MSALLEGCANQNNLDSNGEPPIKLAIAEGNKLAVEMLTDYGAELNILMSRGETLLHDASASNLHEFAQLLLDRGADPDMPNRDGITSRQVASFRVLRSNGLLT